MSGEVHGEANTHDEDNHADNIQVDVPEGHDAEYSNLHGDHCKYDPDDADLAGDEDEDDHGHDSDTDTDTEQGLIEHLGELVKYEE